jgi:hypothetical protein
MDKKYIFKKEFKSQFGVIPIGTEMTVFRDMLYVNGNICHFGYASTLMNIIENNELHKEYLRDVTIEKNEF